MLAEEENDFIGGARHFAVARHNLDMLGHGRYAFTIDALAGQARCALALGNLDEARQFASQVWDYVREHGTTGLELSAWTHKTVADVFNALGDNSTACAAVEAGYHDLVARAARISDPVWRKSFLEDIPGNVALAEMWERMNRTK